MNDDADEVRALLRKEPDLATAHHPVSGLTALHVACDHEQVDPNLCIIKHLVQERNANLLDGQVSSGRRTPLEIYYDGIDIERDKRMILGCMMVWIHKKDCTLMMSQPVRNVLHKACRHNDQSSIDKLASWGRLSLDTIMCAYEEGSADDIYHTRQACRALGWYEGLAILRSKGFLEERMLKHIPDGFENDIPDAEDEGIGGVEKERGEAAAEERGGGGGGGGGSSSSQAAKSKKRRQRRKKGKQASKSQQQEDGEEEEGGKEEGKEEKKMERVDDVDDDHDGDGQAKEGDCQSQPLSLQGQQVEGPNADGDDESAAAASSTVPVDTAMGELSLASASDTPAVEAEAAEAEVQQEEEDEEDEETYLLHDAPEDYVCPISFVLMRDPVVAPDGRTYQRSALEEFFAFAEERKYVMMRMRMVM